MMHIRPIEPDELATFVALHTPAEHVRAVRTYVDRMLAQGAMQIDRCFVLEDAGSPLGRLAYWTLPRVGTPLDVVLLDVPWEGDYIAHGTALLQETVAAMRRIGAGDIGYVLDSPPRPPLWQDFAEQRQELLNHVGFTVARETRRFKALAADVTPVIPERLVFRSLSDVGEDAFLDALERVSAASLDRRTQDGRAELGAPQEARATFQDLQGMEYEPGWWQLAYTHEGALVGLVMPTRALNFVTIGYIGVVPEHRGHGYIDDILGQGTAILQRTGADTIITDTDIANFPMANAFRRAGYTEFAARREYVLRTTTA